jgi:hypothetical protein
MSPRIPAATGASPAVLVLVLAFLCTLPAVTVRIYASDEVQYFSYLRSLWFDADVSFENEYQHFDAAGLNRTPGFHETFLERRTETGRRINFGTIGCAILWAPFYAVADVVARVLVATGHPVATDGYSTPYIAAVSYGSACYGLLALLIALACVRQLGRDWPALDAAGPPAAVAVWIGTPLLFYMYVAPPMSHAPSAFAVALFLLTWLRVRQAWSLRGMIALGAATSLMAMVREQDAFFAVGPALDFANMLVSRDTHERGRRLAHAAAAIVAAAVVFVPQALAYLALNGRVGPSHLVERKMTWTAPHALQVMGSPAHGLLFWTPLAALAGAGLIVLCRRLPLATRPAAYCLIAMAMVQVYVAGSVESWTVAGAFGQRRFVALSAILVIGLAGLLAAVRGSRGLRVSTWLLTGLCCWWNISLMLQFGTGMMDRQRLEPARIAYNTFVVVPRVLPAVTWQYLFDRASFYESTRRLRGGS